MTSRRSFPGAVDALVNRIRDLEEAVKGLRAKAFRVPVLDADPPVGDPVNMWLFPDGRLRVRLPDGSIQSFTPGTAGGTSSSVAKPTPTVAKTYVKTYNATFAQSYTPNGKHSGHLFYGRYSGTWGENRAMIGFPHATIAADLAGATIRKVEIYLANSHSYYNGGVDITFGAHDQAAEPGSYSAVKAKVSTKHWGKTENAWRQISTWFGTALKAGTIKGVTIDQPSPSIGYYGYADGTPRLRITYTK